MKIREVPIPDPPAPGESEDPSEVQTMHTLQSHLNSTGMAQHRTFLNTDRTMHPHPVTQSTGTANNPRRCKPNFQALSLSDSSKIHSRVGATVEDTVHGTEDHGPQEHWPAVVPPPPGLVLPTVAEQLQELGLSEQRTFIDISRRRRQKPVVASTRRMPKSKPRDYDLGSELLPVDGSQVGDGQAETIVETSQHVADHT